MHISLVAALSENRVIGRDGGLPWHLPDDFRHFKRLTTGHCLLVGRRTFDSIGGALPNRTTILISRTATAQRDDDVVVVRSLDDALEAARERGEEEAFVGGGEAIYRLALPRADRLYLTLVHARVEGDTLFPQIDDQEWKLVDATPHPVDERHELAFTIQTYERR